MKRDVVLAYKIVAFGILILPEVAPFFAVSVQFCPFLGSRQVADYCLEPDIEALIFVAFHGHGDSPFNVTGYGSVPETLLEIAPGEAGNVRPPVGLLLGPLGKPVLEGAQFQKKVFRILENRSGSADTAEGLHQFFGVQRFATGIALVAAGAGGAAERTYAFNVTVGQKALALRAVSL